MQNIAVRLIRFKQFWSALLFIVTLVPFQPDVSAATIPGSMTISVKSSFSTSKHVVINWTTSTNATRYGLSVWKYPYGSDKYLVFDNYVTGNSKDIGLLPAGSYRVNMKPYNGSIGGPNSNTIDFTVSTPAPVSSTFTERYTAPSTNDSHYYSSLNPFWPKFEGNCTWYAFGRAWEIKRTSNPTLPYRGNAKSWWSATPASNRGQAPRLGAIAVWDGANNSLNQNLGHVAIVEHIDPKSGAVTVSEGNYLGKTFYRELKSDIDKRAATGKDCGPFLGYIYY